MPVCEGQKANGASQTTASRLPRRLRFALVLRPSTQLLMAFTSTATNIAFPSIEESFDTPRTTLVWAVTGFAIVQASLLLVCGRHADRLGAEGDARARSRDLHRSRPLRGGAGTDGGRVRSRPRLVHAVGAAVVVPSALALVLHEFPASRRIWVATTCAAIFSIGQSADTDHCRDIDPSSQLATILYLWPAVMCVGIGLVADTCSVNRNGPPTQDGSTSWAS